MADGSRDWKREEEDEDEQEIDETVSTTIEPQHVSRESLSDPNAGVQGSERCRLTGS